MDNKNLGYKPKMSIKDMQDKFKEMAEKARKDTTLGYYVKSYEEDIQQMFELDSQGEPK